MDKVQVPFFVPWLTDKDKTAVLETLKNPCLTGGPKAQEFEKNFADYVGVKYAVSVNSCTAALHLALRALNIGPEDEVIVPTLTFAATANAALFCGAKPVFTDVNQDSFTMSPSDVQNKISKKTKAIIVMHYGGQSCDMDEISKIAQENNCVIVEDCAHSLGSDYKGKKTGSIGKIGCFSFYPTKIITTMEGGMLTTNDEKFAHTAKLLREHGMTKNYLNRERDATWYYDVVDLGYNYRLNEVQAALGISQLSRIAEINEKRIEAAKYYTKLLQKVPGIVTPEQAPARTHAYHLYVIKVVKDQFGLDRDSLYKNLSSKGIGLSLHYTPLHLLSFYKKLFGDKTGEFPVSEHIYKQILSLPIFPTITKEQIEYVVEAIKCAKA